MHIASTEPSDEAGGAGRCERMDAYPEEITNVVRFCKKDAVTGEYTLPYPDAFPDRTKLADLICLACDVYFGRENTSMWLGYDCARDAFDELRFYPSTDCEHWEQFRSYLLRKMPFA